MIRIIISFTKIVIAAVVALVFASCKLDIKTIVGSGNVVSQTRNVGSGFTKVSASHGLEVSVEQADQASVIVEADDNLQGHIITKVENGILVITCDYNNFTNVAAKRVKVTMPTISGLEAQAGCDLKSNGVLHSDDMELKTSSGSGLNVNIESDKVIAESSSGSHMSIEGKALSLDISSSSGSENDAGKLLVNDVKAQASSGSNLTVHPILSLDASASSGGSITYNKAPQKNLIKTENSGGSISLR
jgi:hypothetical protein